MIFPEWNITLSEPCQAIKDQHERNILDRIVTEAHQPNPARRVPLANDELKGPRGAGYRRMIEVSAAGRAGTPDEVGTVGALLMGADGAFITGSDFLMDGGVTAAYCSANSLPRRHKRFKNGRFCDSGIRSRFATKPAGILLQNYTPKYAKVIQSNRKT